MLLTSTLITHPFILPMPKSWKTTTHKLALKLRRKPNLKPQPQTGVQGITVIDDVLSRDEISSVLTYLESKGTTWSQATSRGPRFGEAPRQHWRMSTDDAAIADALWLETGLQDAMRSVLPPVGSTKPSSLNTNIRVYKYNAKDLDHFGAHIDDHDDTARGRTEYTFLLYMSDGDLCGGETVFYTGSGRRTREVFRCVPQAGRVLIFRHGAHECLEHESAMVTRGTKIVLRSDVCYM